MKAPSPLAVIVSAALLIGGVAGGWYAVSSIQSFVTYKPWKPADVATADVLGEWSHYSSPVRQSELVLDEDGTFTITAIPTGVFERGAVLADGSEATRWATVSRHVDGEWTRSDTGNLTLVTSDERELTLLVRLDDSELLLLAPLGVDGDEWGLQCYEFSRSGDSRVGAWC